MAKLTEIKDDKEHIITGVYLSEGTKYRFYELGIIEGEKIKRLRASPLKDPTAYFVRGSVLAIREADAMKIEVM